MERGQQIYYHANQKRATWTPPSQFATPKKARLSHVSDPPEEESSTRSEIPRLVRSKMLLNHNPLHLRSRALMPDSPPRGRSPIVLRRRHHSSDDDPRENAGTRKKSGSRSHSRNGTPPVGLLSYPPYISIPGLFTSQAHIPGRTKTNSEIFFRSPTRMEMVRGTTCQLIMQLLCEYRSVREVLDQLPFECNSDDAIRMVFEVKDIQTIARHCRECGLTAHRPLQVDSEDWEGEDIKEWWHEAMEEGWRDDPIVMEGWWTKVGHRSPQCEERLTGSQLERRQHRDWARWPSVSIGARNERKRLRMEDDF